MTAHTFDPDRADKLEDSARYQWCSLEEFLTLLRPDPHETLADFGSGTGFYTDPVAKRVEMVHAVDIQPEMHDIYRSKGVPGNVTQVTADIADLPFDDNELDGAFSTMTYHEFATEEALHEISRVIRPGGKFCVVDWEKSGAEENGPPAGERKGLGEAITELTENGFIIDNAATRTETFVLSGRLTPL